MIHYSTQTLMNDDSVKLDLLIFFQYSIDNQVGIENLPLRAHGNAKNSTHPFIFILSSVIAQIKASLILKILIIWLFLFL